MTRLPAMYLGLCTHTTKHAFLKAFLKPRDGKGYETCKAGSPGEGHYRKRRNVLLLILHMSGGSKEALLIFTWFFST